MSSVRSVPSALPLLQLLTHGRTWTELPGALAAGQAALWNSFWFWRCHAASAGPAGRLLPLIRSPRERRRPRRIAARIRAGAASVGCLFWSPACCWESPSFTLFNRSWLAAALPSAGIVVLALCDALPGAGGERWLPGTPPRGPALSDAARAGRGRFVADAPPCVLAADRTAGGGAWYILFLLCLWDVES